MHQQSSVLELLDAEQKAHDEHYAAMAEEDTPLTLARYEQRQTAYPWQPHFARYSEEKLRFVRFLTPYLQQAANQGWPVLDYACGPGEFACYLALRGCPQVHGFDLSATGVERGCRLARRAGLEERVCLRQMNAQALDYPDGMFPLVIGKAVLHHVIKYPGTAAELHRVMAAGGSALFIENLGNAALWQLLRRRTMAGDQGDVNLTSALIREWASPFRAVRVRGFHVAFMAKRFCFRRQKGGDTFLAGGALGGLLRGMLTGCYLWDELVFNHTPLGNWLGGMCIITLTR
jgi:SAM-dependent methyltransferase